MLVPAQDVFDHYRNQLNQYRYCIVLIMNFIRSVWAVPLSVSACLVPGPVLCSAVTGKYTHSNFLDYKLLRNYTITAECKKKKNWYIY